ncbi:hypothetical protein BH09MYX1_BH09MYX1_43540 [soil metagenome]
MAASIAIATVIGCKPDLEGRPSRIDGPRVLVVRAIPAEVEPRDPFTVESLVVDQNGTTTTTLDYGFCVARKPLSELGSVARACVDGAPGAIVKVALPAVMPDDACRNFGPEVPPPRAGEDPGRPVDPDLTGGYYQPLRAFGGGDRVLAEMAQVRISCGVFGASADQSAEFRAHYHANANPEVASVTVDGVAVDRATPAVVAAGSRVTIRVSWDACPVKDACGDSICGPDETKLDCAADCVAAPAKSCTGAERYAFFDVGARAVVRRRESIVASFYATEGDFDADRSGRAEDDPVNDASSVLSLTNASGLVRGWVVLRDDRGGIGHRSFALQITPR